MAKNGRIMVLYEGHLFRNSLYLIEKQKEKKNCEKKKKIRNRENM
jgi:hypothetical protein